MSKAKRQPNPLSDQVCLSQWIPLISFSALLKILIHLLTVKVLVLILVLVLCSVIARVWVLRDLVLALAVLV